MKSSIPALLTANVLRFRIKLHIAKLIYTSHKNNCQKIQPAQFVITKRDFILRRSFFCEKYSGRLKINTNHKKVNPYLLFNKQKFNKNHEFIRLLNQLQTFLCSYIQNILINITVICQYIQHYFPQDVDCYVNFYVIIVLKAYSIAVLKICRIVIICWICRGIA